METAEPEELLGGRLLVPHRAIVQWLPEYFGRNRARILREIIAGTPFSEQRGRPARVCKECSVSRDVPDSFQSETGESTDELADKRDRVADERDLAAEDRNDHGNERRVVEQRRVSVADVRDRAAESRDRAAEARDASPADAGRAGQSRIDRDWAGLDRDASAGDRAGAHEDSVGDALDHAAAADDREAARLDRLAAAHDREAAAVDHELVAELQARNAYLTGDLEHLQTALATGRTIGVAIGVIMEQRRCTQDEAFRILSGASQRGNVKLRDLAARLIATASLPSQSLPDQGAVIEE